MAYIIPRLTNDGRLEYIAANSAFDKKFVLERVDENRLVPGWALFHTLTEALTAYPNADMPAERVHLIFHAYMNKNLVA